MADFQVRLENAPIHASSVGFDRKNVRLEGILPRMQVGESLKNSRTFQYKGLTVKVPSEHSVAGARYTAEVQLAFGSPIPRGIQTLFGLLDNITHAQVRLRGALELAEDAERRKIASDGTWAEYVSKTAAHDDAMYETIHNIL